jgi:hypothetical protein
MRVDSSIAEPHFLALAFAFSCSIGRGERARPCEPDAGALTPARRAAAARWVQALARLRRRFQKVRPSRRPKEEAKSHSLKESCENLEKGRKKDKERGGGEREREREREIELEREREINKGEKEKWKVKAKDR